MLRIIFPNVVIKCLFPNFMAFALDFCNSLSLQLKKVLMVVIDISMNHIFHVTAPTIKPLIEVLHVWMKAFLVGFVSVILIYWF